MSDTILQIAELAQNGHGITAALIRLSPGAVDDLHTKHFGKEEKTMTTTTTETKKRRRFGYLVRLTEDGTPEQQSGGGDRSHARLIAEIERSKGTDVTVWRSDVNTPHVRAWEPCPRMNKNVKLQKKKVSKKDALLFTIGDEVKTNRDEVGIVTGLPHDAAHLYRIQLDESTTHLGQWDLELVAKVKRQPLYKFGAVSIRVKKVEGEWAAVYMFDGKKDEGKTYYAGEEVDHRHDAIQTAIETIQRLKRDMKARRSNERLLAQQSGTQTRAVAVRETMTDGSFAWNVDILGGSDGGALRFACDDEAHADRLVDSLFSLIEQCVDVSFL